MNELQKKYNEKAQDYSERIAIPREEEKLRKRIEKCERFSGPAWKGEGHLLGVSLLLVYLHNQLDIHLNNITPRLFASQRKSLTSFGYTS